MKKLFAITLLALTVSTGARAEKVVEEFGIFNHVSLGVSAGTTGLGFEVAAPITDFVQMRAGYHFMPGFAKYNTDIDYEKNDGTESSADVEFKLTPANGKILFDIFPGRKTIFHFTVGALIGRDEVLKAHNTSNISDIKPGEAIEVGDFRIGPDASGTARLAIKVKKFKPYVGFGVGRAVPRKRVSVCGDFGVAFWGTPEVYGSDADDFGAYHKITSKDVNGNDGGAFKILSKVKVYPVMTIRINGRIF